ncbi:PfkB family carbohydrate kinase [Nocardia sp. NPDC050408]|uniref:PfkB family carbohydrate kinase n=1 Tax=Nocardia sp. NPDC050408 TaxID=3364319 RepID=UPI0037AE8767
MTTALQLLSELPAPIQAVVFGAEIPRMDTDAGRRVSAAWQRASEELEQIRQRLDAEIALLPEAVRDSLGGQIHDAVQPLPTAVAGSGEFCKSMAHYTDRSTADTDKQGYTMYAFGAMTVYQLLLAGGWHPLRALQVLSEARAEHLARFAAFVAERAGAGAAAVAERAGLLLMQAGGFAALTAGVDAGVQLGQILGILNGHRDSVDWDSVATAGVAGAGAGLGGALGGHLAQAVVPHAAPALLGRAVVAATAGISGVIGGAAAAAAMTGQFQLTLAALASGAAVGMASAHAQARAHPDMAAPTPPAAENVGAGLHADEVVRSDAPAKKPVSAVGISENSVVAETPVHGAGGEDSAASATNSGAGGEPDAALYRRLNELREQELAEARTASGDAAVSGSQHGAEWPEESGSSNGMAHPSGDPTAPGVDAAELARRVAVRDEARAELAASLGVSPQEVRLWGRRVLEEAIGKCDALLGALGDEGWALLDPAVRARALDDVVPGTVDWARKLTEDYGNTASVQQWLADSGMTGQRADAADGSELPAVRRAAETEGAAPVVQLLDQLDRYVAAETHVSSADGRAADGTWDPAHPQYAVARSEQGSGVDRSAHQSAEAAPIAGESAGVVAEPSGEAGAQRVPIDTDGAAPDAATAGADGAPSLEQSIREYGARAGADAVAGARASDFKALQRESARADTELAKWLGLSDTEFHSMSPSRLRSAIECWVERAEQSPHVAEQAREHAGGLIGDEVRRTLAADQSSGRFLAGAGELREGQAVSGDLRDRLRQWVGADAATVDRWTDAHQAFDRLLKSPQLVLRLGAEEGTADPEIALDRARALRERELAETTGGEQSGLTPAAADALAAAGLRPAVSPEPVAVGGSDSGTSSTPSPGSTTPDGLKSNAAQSYSSPPSQSAQPSGSSNRVPSEAVRERDGASVPQTPPDPVRAAALERFRQLREQDLADNETTLTPEARDALAAAGLWSSESVPAGGPEESSVSARSTTPGGSESDGTGPYSAPERPHAGVSESSDRGSASVAVVERDAVVESVPVDPVREAALERFRQLREQDLAETEQTRRADTTESLSDPAQALDTGSAAAGSAHTGAGAPEESAARAAVPPPGDNGGHPGAAAGNRPVESSPETPSLTTASEARMSSVVPGAAMLGLAAAASNDTDAADAIGAQGVPDVRSTVAPGSTAASQEPVDAPSGGTPEGDGPDLRRQHAEATADAAELFGVAPQELKLWGRRLVEQVIDRFEARLAELADRGWGRLDAAVRSGLLADLGEMFGRELRDQAAIRREAASVLDWLCVAGLEPDGTASSTGHRLSVLRRLAEEFPSSPVDRLVEALDRFMTTDAQLEAMPPIPEGTDRRSTSDAHHTEAAPVVAPAVSRPRQTFGESWWFSSPLRPEWIRLGLRRGELARELAREHGVEIDHWGLGPDSPELARLNAELATARAELARLLGVEPDELNTPRIEQVLEDASLASSGERPSAGTGVESGDGEYLIDIARLCLLLAALRETAVGFNRVSAEATAVAASRGDSGQKWLSRLVQMGPGELRRHWQMLQAIPRGRARVPGISSGHALERPPRIAFEPEFPEFPMRPSGSDRATHSTQVPLHSLPVGLWRRPDTARAVATRQDSDRPLLPIAGADALPEGNGDSRPPDPPRAPTPINCAPLVVGYLIEENGSAAIARNLAAAPLTPDPRLGGTSLEQLHSVLGSKRWEPVATWEELADRLRGMQPGAAAFVVTESDHARAVSGQGHARLLFHAKDQPGTIKWRDPLVDDGARQLFEAGKLPSDLHIFALVYEADAELRPSLGEPRPHVTLRSQHAPRLAVAGADASDAIGDPSPSGDVVAGAGNVIGAPSHTRPADISKLEREMVEGNLLSTILYENQLDEIRTLAGDIVPQRVLHQARRAAVAREKKLSAELERLAVVYRADLSELRPGSAYLKQRLEAFEAKARELADQLVHLRDREVGVEDPDHARLLEILRQLDLGPRDGPQRVLRVIEHFQQALRVVDRPYWQRFTRDVAGGGLSNLPEWLIRGILDVDSPLNLSGILWVPDLGFAQRAERIEISDPAAEWRILGEAVGPSSDIGRLIETMIEYLELGRLVENVRELHEEKRLIARLRSIQDKLGAVRASTIESPGVGEEIEVMSRRLESLVRLRDVRDKWLELCGADPSDPNFSIARLRREFEELTASLSADLRAAGVLPPEGELTVGVVRRAETEREIQQRQAPIGTGAGGKLSEIPRFGSRAARHRRLSQLLGYIAECDQLEEVLDSEFERLRKVGKYLAAQLGLDQRQGSHTSAGWLQVGDPRAFEPTGAVDASLRGWGEWIAEAADVRRGVFEAVVRRARQLGVQNADQRAPQELARTVEALIDWALDFRDAVPHPPGIEADRAEAAHTATFGGIVQDYLALFDYALIRERSARAEAATAVARDVLAQNVVDARGGRSLAPQVAVVESGDGAPEVFVAGSVATLGRALDAVAPEVLADLSERGARFHYCEVTVDENGRAYLRDVRPAPVTAPDAAAAQTESEVLAAAPPDPEPVRDGNNDASREAEWDAARAAVERQLDSWRLEGQKGERLTDYVAFLPSESGGRLVVAAPDGMHRRALLDVVTTDSRFVAARWHPRFDRHYLRVSSGPDGPVVTPISAATAEGEYREATVAEVEGILLDEYLRFRRLGLVDTTFGDWIGGLGTQVCYRKKDIRQAAAAGIEATAGHLKRDGTVLVFAYAAAEAQSSVDMDLPHPAAVLVRIATRQIALPVRTDEASDGPWRVVIRGDVDLGVLNPVVEICVDGLAWRVAPPRGRGDAGDILNRWFQGMSATTPDLLLERLAEAVSAGRPPSTARSATPVRRERGKQHRFSDSWQLSATNGRAEIIVDLGRGPDGWLAWPAPDTEAGLLEPLDDLNLRSLVRRVADSLRETSVKSVDRTRRKLEVTLVPEENRRYEDLVREADAAAERFRLWTEACAALASRLGLPEHDGQALGPLREQVSADRAALADELRIDPLELASIPLPDTRLAARRQEILRRESDIREYIDLLEQRGGLTDTLSSTQRRRDDFLTSRVIAAELRGRSDGQSLNNRIGHLPDVAGGVLVVAAPPGRHMASLVELAAERPKFADALWRDELEKRYLAVTLGPDGRIEVRTVPDAEAEGPRRRQSEDEILAQLLDRYLTYREAGVTTRGLREWLVGLDSSIFGAKSQVASSPVSPMSTAEVYGPLRDTDYLLWLGYHKVIAQPAIERSDPAYVLYRLRTRQIPPLAETRPDPSVHRDPVLWATNLGNTRALLLPLEQHEGRWRLSLGSGSVICDVLSRHFPDLTAGTPAELVERLEAFLRDDNPRRVVPWHHRSSVPKTCLLVAADAAGQGTGMRPRFDIPHDRRVQIPLAGVDGKDVSRWARANWHPNGFSDAAQIVAHVRESEGTVVGAVDFGAAGGHAFTVKMDDAVIVVVEQVAYLDDDNMIVTEVRTVRGDKAVDAWAAHLTMTAGEGATFHGVAFKSDGTPELPLSPDEEPVGRRGREIPIRRLGDRPPGRAPPEDDSFEPHAIAEPAQSHMAVAGTGAEDLGPSAPGAADPNVRLAVARRADERRKQLRRELSELLAPHGIDPDELLQTGSLVWADWSARYRDARGALVDMLGIERGRAVDDGWIHHMLAVRDENSSAAPELASARAAFAETTPVARLVDDIQYQTRWARTIQAVEAELARRADEVARLIAQAYALLRAFANFGPRAALLPAIGSVLAAADRRLAARQRLEGQARDLFALGTAIEDYERESFEPIQQQIFRAARRYRSSSWDSRQGMLLLHARLQHLLATAQDEERERSAELRWLEQRAAATVEHYDTIELLNTDLGVALEYMDRALAGVPAASVAPAWRLPELTDDAPFSECLAAVRDNIAHQRRLAFVALLDGLSSEFGLDIPALDERGAGVYDLSRLTSVPPGESERLDTTIGLIHELGRARRRLTRIDTITAAMDEADHRAKLGRERLARLMSDHLRKYPLDRRMSRGELEPDLSEMRAAADACAVGLPGDGWAQAPLEEVRRRVAVLRQGSESAGTTYLADRYLALRQLTDAFDEQTPWSNWYYNLYLHQLRLVALVRRKRKDHLNRAEAENRLGQLAEKAGVDLNRWDSLPEAREALRRMVKRDLRWLSLVLGSDTAPTLRSPDRSRTHTRHLASAPTTLEEMFMRRADLHPRSAVVRERVERWISRTTMVDVVDEIDDLTTSIDRFAPDLDQWLDATMITAGEVGGLEVAPDDGTAEYVPPDSHSVSQCVPLTAALHRARTGNENVNVPDDVGLAGVSFDSYVQFLHGLPQWFPVDPDHPHRSVVKALLDTVASLPVDQRAGVSTIVVDVAHAVNEHGVGAHTYRVEYRCDEHGNHGWLEVQDPGRGLRRAWGDTTKSADLAGIWAMGFDRMGNALRLPGAGSGAIPPDLRIGEGDPTPAVDLDRADTVTLQRAMTDSVVTSAELVEAYLHRIRILDKAGPHLNAIRAVNPNAVAEAERLDAERRRGHVRGPLHGIPILIKDNIDVAGLPTTAGAVALRDSYPSGDAFVVQRLRAAGVVILGKTNMTELANFISEEMPDGYSSLGGTVRNPYNTSLSPDGSSTGSAVAVAAALAAGAVGTETSGSIISPTVANSVIGIKPTVGLVSRTGIVPGSATLDTAGPMARTVYDAAALLTVLAGTDPEDPATVVAAHLVGTDYTAALSVDALRGSRIGVAFQPGAIPPHPAFARAAAVLSAQGATLISVEVPLDGLPDPLYVYELKRDFDRYLARLPAGAPIKTLDELIRFNRTNASAGAIRFGQNRLIRAAAIDPNDPGVVEEYRRHRDLVVGTARERLDAAFAPHRLDALLFVGDTGFKLSARAQYPAVALPIGYDAASQEPVGMMLVGTPFTEASLLAYAYAYEQAARVWRPPSEINPAQFAETDVRTMAFDRNGLSLLLPGADIGEPPIDLQIGQGTRTTLIPDPHDRDYQKLGDWLAAVRRHYGVTQQQLADRIHRGSRTVWRAERRGTISADYLRAFGRAFGISDEVLHIAVSRLEPRLAHYFSGALPDPASNIYRTMGGWLKAIREHYGLTQMEVANRMNLHMETVSRAEKDFRVTGNYLQVFGRALSISDEVLHAAARQLEPHIAHYFSGALPDPASNVYRTIGGWLEAVREYYGLTQLQVAERVNRAHKTVWNAENGAVTADYLQAFGNAFDIPNDVLYRATSLLEPGLAHYFSSNIPQPATSLHQNIGDWLTAVRQQRGLSQQEVATLMRRHIKTISAVENSDSATLDFLRTWRDALDVPDQAIRAAVQQFLAPASPVDRPEDEDFWRLIATKPGSTEETSIRNRIYQEYDWVAKAAAQRWPMIFESREDLTQRYAIAILRAIVNHIPAGPPFVAHAWAASRGAMRSTYFEWRFPGLEASERTRAVKVYTYRNKRYAETGEMPDIREIADALDLTSDQVTAARQIIETTTGSLDDTRHGEIRARQVADPNPQGAYTGGTDSDSDLDGFDDDSPFVGKVRAALADLPDPEAAIRLVELHFVHGVPLDDAAVRLDIDHIAATEILARAVDNLRAEFTEAPDAGSITEPDAGPETGPRVNRPSGAITEEVDRDADAADQPPTGEAFSEPPQHSDVGRDHAADGVFPEFEDASGRTAYDPAATTVEPETSDSEATSNTAAPTPMLSAHAEPDDLAVARAADADSVVGLSDEVLSGAPAPGPLGSPRVVTAGNVVIDVIVDFDELPGVEEYRDARSIRDTPGGKALNQGIAAARLGAIVDVVSVTGADGSGTEIRETLRREGIRFDGMRIEDDIATGKVACFVGPDGETSFIYHISRELDLTSDDIRRSIGAIENADIVLLTFTAPDATVAQIAAVARENGAMVVLQPAPPRDQVSFDTVRMADVLVPNETEARALLAAASSDAASADAESLRADLLPERLFELLGVPTIVVTLGAAGCAVHHQGRTELFEAHSASVVDTTGASDAFTAALAMGVVAGLPVSRAVQIGLSAAAHAVAHSGGHESMPHAHDLDLSLMGASSEEGVPTNPTSGSASEAVARPAGPSEPTSEPADSWPEQGRSDAEQRDDARPADGGAPSRETAIADGFRRWHETRVRNQEAGFGTQSLGQYARMHNVDGRQIRRWLAEIGAEPDNAPDAPVPHPHTFDLPRDWASHVRRYLALTPDDMDVLTDAAPGSWQGIEDGARRPPADQVRALLRRVPDARHLYAPLAQVFCSDLAAGPPADVGSSLRRLREYSGLTREQLAHELGVIPMTIDNREAADHLVPKGWEAHVRALAARLSDGIDGDADIGVCLRVLRLRTGLPRRSLAAKMDMAEDIIADIEAGRSQPSKDIVEACLCSIIPGTPIFPEGYPHAGRYLRYRREQAGISLSQVATATGMTVAMVRQREAGAVPLSTEMVEAYLGDDDFDLSIRRNIIEVFPSLNPAHDQNFGRRNVPDYSSEVLLFPDPRNTRNLVDYKDQFQRVNGLTDIGVRRMFGLYQGRPPAGGVDAALRVYDRFLWQAGHWNDFAAAWGYRYRMDPLGESAPDPGDFQSILDWQEATRLYHRTTAAVFREGRPDFRGASAAEKQAGLAQLHRMGEAGYISAEMTRRAAEQFHITDPAARPTPWSSRGSAPSTEPGTRSATPWSARAETSTRSAEDHPDDPAPQA